MLQHQMDPAQYVNYHAGYCNMRDFIDKVLNRLNKVYNNTHFALLKTSDNKEYFHFNIFSNVPAKSGFKARPYWYDFSTFIGRIYLNDVLNGLETELMLRGDNEGLRMIGSLRSLSGNKLHEPCYGKLIDLVCDQVLIRYKEYVVDELIGGTYLKELDTLKVADKYKYIELFKRMFHTNHPFNLAIVHIEKELKHRTQKEVEPVIESVVIDYSNHCKQVHFTDERGKRIDNWTIAAKIIDELASLISEA